jgi:hypothetical protein
MKATLTPTLALAALLMLLLPSPALAHSCFVISVLFLHSSDAAIAVARSCSSYRERFLQAPHRHQSFQPVLDWRAAPLVKQ